MEQRLGADSAVGRLLRNFLARMGEEQRVNRVADIIKFTRLKNPQDIVRYLSNLNADTVPLLLDALEVIELPENRTLLCDVMIPWAKDLPDPFVNRLQSEKPQVVRDMIYVLDRSNHPEKLKFFSSVLKSKNLAIKLEVMSIIARGRTGEARKLISAMLEDPNQPVRIQAARVLPEFDREKGFLDLMKLVKDPQFEKRSPEEHEALYAAIGSTGVNGAIAYFIQLLQVKPGLFNKEKVKQDKVLAVAGLGGACNIQTAKLLQEIVEDKTQPPEVVNHAKLHLASVCKALFGSPDKEA
jgi:HEAT repeat protein